MQRARTLRSKGSSLVELSAAFIVIIPFLYFCVELATVVLADKANQELAQNAARLAANQGSKPEATRAAYEAVASFHKWDSMHYAIIKNMNYDLTHKMVFVNTEIELELPLQFPVDSTVLTAKSAQHIVAIPTP